MSSVGERTRIRTMRSADVEHVLRMIQAGGWGDRRPFLAFHRRFTAAHLFVGESVQGELVGTVAAFTYGVTGWIGMLFVAPEWRRLGLGLRLTQAALQRLEDLGCASVLLAATHIARPIYE